MTRARVPDTSAPQPWPGEPVEPGGAEHADAGATDGEGTRLDRELAELLQELRVILPGVQVLFAFLLAVPFSTRFGSTDDIERGVFFLAFVATTLSSVCTIAPSVQHRLRWRRYDKDRLLRDANRLTLAGTFLLAIAIDAAAFLVADFLYGVAAGAALAGVTGLAALMIWWLWPISREVRGFARRERG